MHFIVNKNSSTFGRQFMNVDNLFLWADCSNNQRALKLWSHSKHKARKEASFLWSVSHKAVPANKRRGQIWVEIDKSCLHCGSPSVESGEHKLFSYPLVQQVWRYATNLTWQPIC